MPAVAQELPSPPTAPTLTNEQAAQLKIFELALENAQLKAALAQAQAEAVSRDSSLYLRSLQKDRYTLTRTEQGWVYVPVKETAK